MQNHISRLEAQLLRRQQKNMSRKLSLNANLTDFCSNDYLGYSKNNSILKEKEQLVLAGSTGSRLLTGNCQLAQATEQKLATYFNAEGCLLFPSGYTANLALLSTLPQRNDLILTDKLVHASIIDGYRLHRGIRQQNFEHNNLQDLENKLEQAEGNVWVVIESLYSMDGDRAPLGSIAALCKKYGAALLVDEAHSAGIWGPNGSGLCIAEGIENDCLARVYTFGKAFGYHGACIVGSQQVIDYLINFARPFIYSTAMPASFYSHLNQIIAYRQQHNEEVRKLLKNIMLWAKYIDELNIKASTNNSPIQSVIIGGNAATRNLAHTIQGKGFDVRPILSPTVPEGTERLRVCLHSYNTEEEISRLTQILANQHT